MNLRLRRTVQIASVVGLGIGLGIYFASRPSVHGLTQADSTHPATTSVVSDKVQGQGVLKHSLDTGVIRTFSVDQELSVEMSPAQGQSTVSQIHVRGRMDEQLLAVEKQQLTYRFKFSAMNFETTNAQGQPALSAKEAESIEESLNGSTLMLRTDVFHSSLSWSASQSTSMETLNLLRSIVLAGTVFLPDVKELSEWTGTEEDSTGVFTLTHRLISLTAGKARIEKEPRMVRVQEDFTQGNSGNQTVVVLPSSITRLDFDATSGHLLKADQRWAMRAQTAGLLATTQLHTQVEFVGKRAATENEMNSFHAGSAAPSQEFLTEFELQAAHSVSLKKKVAAQKLGSESWPSLRSRFQSSDFHKDGAARAQFFEQLSALLYLKPELCTNVAEEIAQLDKKDPDYKSKLALLSGVFSSQETPEAEAAMAALAERLKDDSPALMQVLPALAAHRNPSERTRDALMQFYTSALDEGVKSTATLGLGTFASRAKGARPDLTREAVDRLKQDFDSISSTDKKVTLSGALGNAGAREAFESVQALYDGTQDASLKRSAIYDLRFVNDARVDSFLEKIVSDSNTDPELVIQGVRVIRMRPPQKMHLQTSIRLFRAKTSRPTMRSEALYTISYLSPVSPEEVRKVLEEAASDQNSQIAKQAEQLLARQSQAQSL